jgi:putative two-component system hydrogenase maturation factor HypX/HoxX
VTAIEAAAEMDAGDIWVAVTFPMRDATKSSLYRNEVTEAAVLAIRQVLVHLALPGFRPQPLDPNGALVRGCWRPSMRQADRAIDWHADATETVLRKVRAADGFPGVRDVVLGLEVHLYDVHREGAPALLAARAEPGAVIARRAGAICLATVDAAVWITHLKRADGTEPSFKLPAAMVLGDRLAAVPEVPLPPAATSAHPTWRPIRYDEEGPVGYLHFPFYNGAMGTGHCEDLRAAVAFAKARPIRVLVLCGGPDFWSNGIHLNLIEAAAQPADESWANINAMNDLVLEIVTAEHQITIAALQGNAGAGGVFLALAADRVVAREGVVLNPHYRAMGNLYGSEYWTYLLPRRVGDERAGAITGNRLPIGAAAARASGLIDDCFGATSADFLDAVRTRAQALARHPEFDGQLAARNARRAADEAAKPLAAYRADELERMRLNFYGFDASYHVARQHFVHKRPRSRTPHHLARHRGQRLRS